MSSGRWAIREHHRRLLAREEGTVVKDPGGRLRVVVLYPNTYQVGMANLGLGVVYRLINARSDALCERAFLPGARLAALYRKHRLPLASLESSRPVAEFDLVLACLHFENDAPNLAAMLEMAGLGVSAAHREGPLVVAGGVVPMLNPEPYAELADGFLLGEAEVVLAPFLEAFLAHGDRPREELLLALGREVPGFYAPRFYRPRYRADGTLAEFRPLAEVPARIPAPKYGGAAGGLAVSVVRAPGPQFGDMTLIEVGRGCGHGCRFCAAGHIFRPPRLGRGGDFLDAARRAAREGGKVGLVSSAVGDLPGVEELAQAVVAAGGRVSVSSLRADRLSPELAQALAASGTHSVALAPEAGSARLRRVVNKHITEDHLVRAVETLAGAGLDNLKLYFMLGLPTEEEEDVAEIAALVRRLRQQVVSLGRERGRLGRLGVSVNAFVPKPFTPFQWEPMASQEVLRARLRLLQGELAGLANLKLTHDVAKYARLQAALARGDRRLGRLVVALGRGMDLARAERELGLDLDFYTTRPRRRDELLPWAFVDHGLEADYLWQEAARARQAKESPSCQVETCRRCGVCGAEGAG